MNTQENKEAISEIDGFNEELKTLIISLNEILKEVEVNKKIILYKEILKTYYNKDKIKEINKELINKYLKELKPPKQIKEKTPEQKEKHIQQMKEWRQNNKDKLKEWRDNNKDKIKEYRHNYVQNNKDKFKQYKDRYFEKHPEKYEEMKEKKKLLSREYYNKNKVKVLAKMKDKYNLNKLNKQKNQETEPKDTQTEIPNNIDNLI